MSESQLIANDPFKNLPMTLRLPMVELRTLNDISMVAATMDRTVQEALRRGIDVKIWDDPCLDERVWVFSLPN